LEARVAELEASLVESQKYALSWQKESQTANKLSSKLQADLEASNEEKQTWKSRYETKCKETADKLSLLEFIQLKIKQLWKK